MTDEIKLRIEQINRGEVPQGYKKTEVGIVPCEWKVDKLRSIGFFEKGRGIPGTAMKKEGVPCVGYGDIYTKYNYKFDKAVNFVDEDVAKTGLEVNKGALLFTCSGETAIEIGKCVCYTGEESIYAGGDIAVLNIKKDIDPLFAAYQQNISASINKKATYGQGHSVVHIYSDSLGKLEIAYPKDIKEQQHISEILSKWDEAVSLNTKLIDYLEQQKRAYMQKLLSENKNWTKVKIGSLIEEVSKRNTIECTNIKSVSNKYGFINQDEQFSKQVASVDTSNYKIVSYGDIAYNPSRINVGSIAVYKEQDKGIVSPMYVVFKCKDIESEMLLLILNLDRVQYDIKAHLAGSVRNSLSFSDLSEIEINLPSKKEQHSILEFFKNIDTIIALQNNKLNFIKKQQNVMKELLLSGIIRV